MPLYSPSRNKHECNHKSRGNVFKHKVAKKNGVTIALKKYAKICLSFLIILKFYVCYMIKYVCHDCRNATFLSFLSLPFDQSYISNKTKN